MVELKFYIWGMPEGGDWRWAMQARHRYLIEAALDPKGKWYGTVWPDRPAAPALDVEPVRQEGTVVLDRDMVAAPEPPGPTRPAWDEWEPA